MQPGRRLKIHNILVCCVHSSPNVLLTSLYARQTIANNYHYTFCPFECLSQCLYLESKTCFFRPDVCFSVSVRMNMSWCVSTADDGSKADFLKDLFTIAPSIRVFVVVISLPVIIITGPHLASTPHHFFLAFFSQPWQYKHTSALRCKVLPFKTWLSNVIPWYKSAEYCRLQFLRQSLFIVKIRSTLCFI